MEECAALLPQSSQWVPRTLSGWFNLNMGIQNVSYNNQVWFSNRSTYDCCSSCVSLTVDPMLVVNAPSPLFGLRLSAVKHVSSSFGMQLLIPNEVPPLRRSVKLCSDVIYQRCMCPPTSRTHVFHCESKPCPCLSFVCYSTVYALTNCTSSVQGSVFFPVYHNGDGYHALSTSPYYTPLSSPIS